ncbi:MAG: DUF4339 domain-containing protein [bacterium]
MTDAPRFFYNRQGDRSGPHSLDEILAFIRAGEIDADKWVFREGDDKWKAATSFPELAGALAETTGSPAAVAAPVDPVLPAMCQPQASKRPSSLSKVPYTAGQKPVAPGPYVRLSHLPQDAAALLTAAIPPPPPPHVRHSFRTVLLIALLLLAATAIVADVAAGFDRWVFAEVLVPMASLGILFVMLATHSRPRAAVARVRASLPSSVATVIGTLLLVSCVGGGMLVAFTDTTEGAVKGTVMILLALLFVVVASGLRDSPPADPTAAERAQVSGMMVCRDVVAALADDVAPAKMVTGWADLTGAQQPVKLMAEGKSGSGATVELFRDEWFQLSAVLRDGSRLRLAAVDRQKVKHPVTRTRGRKTKTKPGSTQTLSTLEIRVRVNPQVYRPMAPLAQTGQVGGLQLASIQATPDAVSAVFTPPSELQLTDVMHALSHVYRHLERLPAAGGGGTP